MNKMKILSGADLADYIKVRQIGQARALRQADGINPKLAIVVVKQDPVIETYVRLKKNYGADIFVDVDIYKVSQNEAIETIKKLNSDKGIHGIIVQLPLEDISQTDQVINTIAPEKDVDGLGEKAAFDPATPTAINWLLAGYNIDIKDKKIAIIGNGRLVGKPLYDMWSKAGYDVETIEKDDDFLTSLKNKELIIAATGQPGIVKSQVVPIESIVVDAGVASDSGKTVGDVDQDVYERDDITITPRVGGVGPLTVAALFDNVIRAARSK